VTVTPIFEEWRAASYPFTFYGRLHVPIIVGGIPSNPDVMKGWIESKVKDNAELIQQRVAQTMVEMGVTADQAIEEVKKAKSLNRFKRDEEKGLYIEGRQLKAALKEAVSVAVAAKKIEMTGWGATRKWLTKFLPEHVFVVEERLFLGVFEETGVLQQFVHARNQSSIQYQEYVENAEIDFTVVTDYDFTDKDWAMIWTTGELQGLGASRSQGYGTYSVTKWDKHVDQSAMPETTRVKTKKAAA
jgi:hypothetical protein